MDKSYVTLELCPICHKETGSLLLDRKVRNIFEKQTVNPTNVCPKCRAKYLGKGVLLINPNSGSLAVIKDSAFKKMFNVPIPKGKIAFAEEDVLSRFIRAEHEMKEKKLKEVV